MKQQSIIYRVVLTIYIEAYYRGLNITCKLLLIVWIVMKYWCRPMHVSWHVAMNICQTNVPCTIRMFGCF